jgi:hypothetical protein
MDMGLLEAERIHMENSSFRYFSSGGHLWVGLPLYQAKLAACAGKNPYNEGKTGILVSLIP